MEERIVKGPFHNKPVVAALVLPGVAVLVFAIVVPLCFSVYFSFTNRSLLGSFKYVGLENYREILGVTFDGLKPTAQDPTFWRSLWNALLLMVVTIFVQNPIAFALAAALSHINEKASQVLRTIYFVPAVLSLVIIAKLWVSIFNPNFGILNKLLVLAGLKAWAVAWLSNPHTAIWAVLWIIIWQGFGWALLFYYAGLMTVPKEIEEAARMDGASWFQTYARVIVPYLFPVISAVIVIDVISCMKQMELILFTTEGGPGHLTQFVGVYLYQKAFVADQYGYGNALSVLFVIVSVGLTLLVQRLLRSTPEAA
jgi:raffinose/stachyose/melibiose transport system permease protein